VTKKANRSSSVQKTSSKYEIKTSEHKEIKLKLETEELKNKLKINIQNNLLKFKLDSNNLDNSLDKNINKLKSKNSIGRNSKSMSH